MKDEKYKPASSRQLKRLAQLGVTHSVSILRSGKQIVDTVQNLTQHMASRLINEAIAQMRLGRGVRLPLNPTKELP